MVTFHFEERLDRRMDWIGFRHSTDGRTDGRRFDDAGGRGTNGDDASTGEFSTRDGGYAGAGEEGAR